MSSAFRVRKTWTFLDSLSRSTKIKLILTRHEQGAGFMAATYGRHTGKAGREPGDAWARRHQSCHRRRLCPAGRHADDDDHRPEADQKLQAGPFPDPGSGGHDAAAHQVHPSDRFRRQYPVAGARSRPPGAGGKARRGAYRIPRRHRRRGKRFHAAEGKPGAPPGGRREGRARRGRPHRARQVPAAGDRRRRQPRHDQPHADPVRGKDRHPLCHHPAGQGRDRRAQSQIRGLRRAVIRRLRPCRRRRRRCDHQYRP